MQGNEYSHWTVHRFTQEFAEYWTAGLEGVELLDDNDIGFQVRRVDHGWVLSIISDRSGKFPLPCITTIARQAGIGQTRTKYISYEQYEKFDDPLQPSASLGSND